MRTPEISIVYISFVIVWSSKDSTALANIRTYVRKANGDLQPTKQGISLTVKNFDALKSSIVDLSLLRTAQEVLVNQRSHPRQLPPPNLVGLLDALPFVMFKMWLKRLQDNCPRCTELQMIFKEPTQRDAFHTCHWKAGMTVLALSDSIKSEIMKELQGGRKILGKDIFKNQIALCTYLFYVKGCLLLLNPFGSKTDVDSLLTFDVRQFLDENYTHLWSAVKSTAMEELKVDKVVDC